MSKVYLLLGIAVLICRASAEKIECLRFEFQANDRTCIDQPELITSTCNATKCYTKKENGFVERGCVGVTTDCETAECLYCSEDKCNAIKVTSNSTIYCYRCKDSPSELGDDLIEPCLERVPYYQMEKCFTNIFKSGDKVKVDRGCFYDLTEEEQKECDKSANCRTCNSGKNCNEDLDLTLVYENFECNICRSNSTGQEDCALELKGDLERKFNKKCSIPPKTDQEKACFVDRLPHDVIIRDCITALVRNISEESCGDNVINVKCNFCSSQNCNSMKPRSSGVALRVFGGLIAFTVVFVTKWC